MCVKDWLVKLGFPCVMRYLDDYSLFRWNKGGVLANVRNDTDIYIWQQWQRQSILPVNWEMNSRNVYPIVISYRILRVNIFKGSWEWGSVEVIAKATQSHSAYHWIAQFLLVPQVYHVIFNDYAWRSSIFLSMHQVPFLCYDLSLY